MVSGFANLSQGTYQECMDFMKSAAQANDLNNDKFIDRCESAKFLKGIGNSEEYSLNYASSGNLLDLQHYCKIVVIDAFDMEDDVEDDLL